MVPSSSFRQSSSAVVVLLRLRLAEGNDQVLIADFSQSASVPPTACAALGNPVDDRSGIIFNDVNTMTDRSDDVYKKLDRIVGPSLLNYPGHRRPCQRAQNLMRYDNANKWASEPCTSLDPLHSGDMIFDSREVGDEPQVKGRHLDASITANEKDFFTVKMCKSLSSESLPNDAVEASDGAAVETLVAIKGVTLKEALSGVAEKHQINLECINVFVKSSSTPLPFDTDVSFLGGLKLFMKTMLKTVH
ncbi:unnamed protein product [Soboliphyme baturini]|uniref:RBD domain-containing protein n=1 Tax=Soboliphyme baturini TaxID=241478 RepID=A0A3P8ANX3_9BILA|nr:unnamed protein product [Soboliphyme baturini]